MMMRQQDPAGHPGNGSAGSTDPVLMGNTTCGGISRAFGLPGTYWVNCAACKPLTRQLSPFHRSSVDPGRGLGLQESSRRAPWPVFRFIFSAHSFHQTEPPPRVWAAWEEGASLLLFHAGDRWEIPGSSFGPRLRDASVPHRSLETREVL